MRKLHTVFVAALALSLNAYESQAQLQPITFINKVEASLNFGFTKAYTDAIFPESSFGMNIGVHYFPISFFAINPSFEFGRLAAGDAQSSVAANRQFVNKFTGGNITARLFPLKIFLTNAGYNKYFNGIYAGAGVGFISSKVTADQMGNGYVANPEKMGTTYPVEFGINMPVYDAPKGAGQGFFNVNYRYYYSNTDLIDGYKPTVAGNLHDDVYDFISVGFVYRFN